MLTKITIQSDETPKLDDNEADGYEDKGEIGYGAAEVDGVAQSGVKNGIAKENGKQDGKENGKMGSQKVMEKDWMGMTIVTNEKKQKSKTWQRI